MKITFIFITLIATFIIAFITSYLLEYQFFKTNIVRYLLVVLMIIIELILGFFIFKRQIIDLKN